MNRFDDNYKVNKMMKYYSTKKPEELAEALASPNYGLQKKMDGSSYYLAKDLDGTVHLYKDSMSKKTGDIQDKIENVPHLKEYAEKNFPNGSQLVVEICSNYDFGEEVMRDHSNSKYVNSIMLSLPKKAIERQESTDWVRAYVFDVTYWDSKPFYKEDFAIRNDFLTNEIKPKMKESPFVEFAITYLNSESESNAARLNEWLENGEEGGVLKLLHSTNKASAAYAINDMAKPAKRPAHTTYKIKQMDTIDVIIVDVMMPTKEYTGKDPDTYQYRDEDNNPVNRLWALGYANAIKIGLMNGDKTEAVGTIASGLTDEMRESLAQNPQEWIGQVAEVECMSLDNDNHTLRHPRFIKLRPDKPAEECTITDVFGG